MTFKAPASKAPKKLPAANPQMNLTIDMVHGDNPADDPMMNVVANIIQNMSLPNPGVGEKQAEENEDLPTNPKSPVAPDNSETATNQAEVTEPATVTGTATGGGTSDNNKSGQTSTTSSSGKNINQYQNHDGNFDLFQGQASVNEDRRLYI